MGSTRKNSKQIVVKTNEIHDWLPDGWIMESKIRKSGVRVGTEYKCYVDPSSRSKFYSKPEVLRYLKTRKQNADSSGQQKPIAMETSKHETSPLPFSKTFPNHSNSEEESDHAYGQRTSGSILINDKNVVVEREKIEDLPDGWIKEIRIRKTTRGIRKDPYYKDEVSGRVFRSKKEVFRFLGDKFKLSSAAKPQELKHSSTRTELFLGEEESDLADIDVSPANMPNEVFGEALEKKFYAEAGEVIPVAVELAKIGIVNGKVQNTCKKTRSKPGASNEKNVHERSHYSRRLSRVEPEIGTKTVANEQAFLALNGTPLQNKTILSNNLASEEFKKGVSSQGIQHRSVAPLSVSTGLDEDITTGRTNNNKTKTVDNGKSLMYTPMNKKENSLPRRASKRLAGVEPELIDNSMSCDKPLEYTRKRSKKEATEVPSASTVSLRLENARAENLDDQKAESNLSMSFHYSWSDPCVEFAIKTLTGALSVENTVGVDHTLNVEINNSQHRTNDSGTKNCQVKARKSKKELHLPSRSSKRLAGHEPEHVAKQVSSERALEYLPRKSYKKSQGTSQQLEERQKNVEVAEIDGEEKSEPQTSFSFCDSWSDPCIDFAIKTLTGTLSEDTAHALPISHPDANLPYRKISQDVGERIIDNQVCLPAKLLGSERKWMACSTPSKSNKNRAKEQSFGEEAKPERETNSGTFQHLEIRKTEYGRFDSSTATTSMQEASLEKISNDFLCQTVSEAQNSGSFLESWSDPCLDFAIKTLTGAIPVEENYGIPGYLQQVHTSTSQAHASSVLPDLGLPAFFQNDISSHFDIPDKSGGVQQSPHHLPLVAPGDASLVNCAGTDSSSQFSQSSKNVQGGLLP